MRISSVYKDFSHNSTSYFKIKECKYVYFKRDTAKKGKSMKYVDNSIAVLN
jgi:hypothetical protein